jgi:molybdopterin molybdotransferase
MVFGLPGNPVSAYVCTLRLASRIISRLAGGAADSSHRRRSLVGDLPANGPRELYLPAVENEATVRPLQPNGSADLFTLAAANAFIVRRENAEEAAAGASVEIVGLP